MTTVKDPQQEGTALPLQELRQDLQRDQGNTVLLPQEESRPGRAGSDVVSPWLAKDCPVQAIVAAFGLDERILGSPRTEWLSRSGEHCQKVHEKLVGEHKFELGQVQADEIRVKAQGEILWLAQVLGEPRIGTRLWLGGVVGERRDFSLIAALVTQLRQVALCRELLLAVDGLASYVSAFRQAFRVPLYTGKAGRPRLLPWPNVAIVQVIKRRIAGVLSVERRVAQGSEGMIQRVLRESQGGGVINTAYIERLNAILGMPRTAPGLSGKAQSRSGAHARDARTGHAPGRLRLQLLHTPLLGKPRTSQALSRRTSLSLGQTHASHGRRSDQPLLVHHGSAVFQDSTSAL